MDIDLIVADVEGCITPAKRTETNLYGLSEVQKYSKKVNKENLPPIILLTGRPVPYCEKVIQDIGALGPAFKIPSVVENGAVYWDHNKRSVWGYNPAVGEKKKDLKKVRSFVEELKENYKNNVIEEPGKEICISLNPKELGITDLYDIVNEEFERKGLDEIVNITHSASAVDITPKGVSKLTGLDYILKERNIEPKNVLGVGDSRGDIEWLSYVGIPTAPLNATDDLKKEVDNLFISDYKDSKGFGHILQHFILKYSDE